MPWCEDCERFANPNSLDTDGSCPSCGAVIAESPEATGGGESTAEQPSPPVAAPATPQELRRAALGVVTPGDRAPWHFWVLLAAVVVYLGWRLVQGVAWVVG